VLILLATKLLERVVMSKTWRTQKLWREVQLESSPACLYHSQSTVSISWSTQLELYASPQSSLLYGGAKPLALFAKNLHHHQNDILAPIIKNLHRQRPRHLYRPTLCAKSHTNVGPSTNDLSIARLALTPGTVGLAPPSTQYRTHPSNLHWQRRRHLCPCNFARASTASD